MNKGTIYSYSAGLFDGEGYLGLIKHRNKSGSISFTCTAQVSNTNKEIIEWLARTHGGKIQEVKRKTLHHSTEKMQWRWTLTRRNGLRTFLRYIEFYSIIKRDQIKLAREFMAGNIAAEIALERMKGLNHRGTKISPI